MATPRKNNDHSKEVSKKSDLDRLREELAKDKADRPVFKFSLDADTEITFPPILGLPLDDLRVILSNEDPLSILERWLGEEDHAKTVEKKVTLDEAMIIIEKASAFYEEDDPKES